MYDIVTFDIFDTLVHRRLRAPVDVFEAVRLAAFRDRRALLNHDILALFSQQRQLAESEARRIYAERTGGEGEITFDEIYDQYQAITGCSTDLRDFLAKTELELEKVFLFASKPGQKAFEELRAQAKRVAFISDMYLPSEFLLQMLEGVGFADARQIPIFVSCEERKSKHSGALYQEVRKRLGIAEGAKWLHVGDNKHADIEMAARAGLKTKFADWSKVENRWRGSKISQSDYLASSIADFSSLPQAEQFLPTDVYARAGYQIFGPLIFGFTLWILAKAKESRAKHMAFIARDGWLPMALFDELKGDVGLDKVRSSYVHFSRAAGVKLGVREWDNEYAWMVVGGRTKRSFGDMMQTGGIPVYSMLRKLEQFGFTSLTEAVGEEEQLRAQNAVKTAYTTMLQNSLDQRREFGSYFTSTFKPGEPTCIVDIGWHGNIQRMLMNVLGPEYPREQFTGLYLGLHERATVTRNLGHVLHGWMSNFGDEAAVSKSLYTGGVELLEFALTADHGTTLGYEKAADGSVKPILEALQPEEQTYRELAMRVQSGIRKYVSDHRYLLQILDPATLASRTWRERFLTFVNKPTAEEIELFAGLTHSDGAGATATRLPLAARLPEAARKSRSAMDQARQQSFWHAAFDKLNA